MSQRGVSKKVSVDDRSSMYKTKSRGIGDRLVRGIRFQAERKQSRMNEIDKRRRTLLSPLKSGNGASDIQETKKIKVIKQDTVVDTKEKQTVDKRREKLFKWREEKLLCKKAEELGNAKKKAFVVKQVTYLQPPISTLPKQNAKKKTTSVNEPGTKSTPRCIGDTTFSCATRTSANKVVKERVGKYSKDTGCSVKTKKQVVENKSRRTRSAASKQNKQVSASVQPTAPCKTRMTTRFKSKTEPKILSPTAVPAETTTTTTTAEIVDDNSKATMEDSLKQRNDFTKVKPNNIITLSSIVPNDFSFKAPVGLHSFNSLSTSFKFEPMSPSSAEQFMFPSASSVFDDVPVTMAMIEAEKVGSRERGEDFGKNKDCVEDEKKDERVLKDNPISSIGGMSGINGEIEDNCNGVNMNENNPAGSVVDTAVTVDEEAGSLYFQSLVNTETNRLQDLCSLWKENDGEDTPPEEVQGLIRTVIGQVQLLVTKKFKQFRGLIEKSEDPNAERKTLSSDLQGFWDMIYFQVEDIDRKFKKLEELKLNNWKEIAKEVKKVTKKKATKKKLSEKPSKTGAAAEARNKFREIRAKMKVKLQEKVNDSQEAFKMVLIPVENKKSRIDQGEAEVVLTPVRRSTRKSLSSQPHVVSTPKQQQDFELRLTPTVDEEPDCAEGGTNELKESGVNLKDGNEEIAEQETVGTDAISERGDTASAEFSSENFEPAQTSNVDTQHSTGGPSPTGVSTTEVPPMGILTNPCVFSSTLDEGSKEGKNVSAKSSRRKHRRMRSSRVMFTCSSPSEDLAGTQSKRSCRNTLSRRRVPTPFCNKIMGRNEKASSSSDVTEISSESERTEDEQKKTPRRMSSNKKMTKPHSSSKKHDSSGIETPKRNLAADVEKEANESCDFDKKYLQPTSSAILANVQVDNVKTPNTSLYTSSRPSQSELVTPTPSKLTKTPMPEIIVTPTLSERNAHLTPRDESSKASAQACTPYTMLANFHLDESGNESELINDSTFFPRDKPGAQSTAEVDVSPTVNLIFFSPTTPLKRACKNEAACGSVRKFAPVTPSKKLESYLGTDAVFSPVRRSARIEAKHHETPKRPAFHSLSDIPDDTDFGYVPNKALV